jgi:hypothetical protein
MKDKNKAVCLYRCKCKEWSDYFRSDDPSYFRSDVHIIFFIVEAVSFFLLPDTCSGADSSPKIHMHAELRSLLKAA